MLQSRCTDEQGDVQPSLAELNKAWGVDNDYWLSKTRKITHRFNAILPWKLSQDGSVHNALFA